MTNSAVASQLNSLAALGMTRAMLRQLQGWAETNAVSLRFHAEEYCSFVKEESREVENPTKTVEEFSVGGLVKAAVTNKTVKTVTEYFWTLKVSYRLIAMK
eukprot:4140759-Amphidinium_carterae.1